MIKNMRSLDDNEIIEIVDICKRDDGELLEISDTTIHGLFLGDMAGDIRKWPGICDILRKTNNTQPAHGPDAR